MILSDIDPDKAGVASGANTTVRQVGLALGIATFASFIDASTDRRGGIADRGRERRPARRCSSRPAVVAFGALLSLLIPQGHRRARLGAPTSVVTAFESIDVG